MKHTLLKVGCSLRKNDDFNFFCETIPYIFRVINVQSLCSCAAPQKVEILLVPGYILDSVSGCFDGCEALTCCS